MFFVLVYLQVKEAVARSKGNLTEAELICAEDRVTMTSVDDPHPSKSKSKSRGSGEMSSASDISELNRRVGSSLMTIDQTVAAAVQRTPPSQHRSQARRASSIMWAAI